MPRRLANIPPKQPHVALLAQSSLGITRKLPFYLPRSSLRVLCFGPCLLGPSSQSHPWDVQQKATQAAALATKCTEASIHADLLHAHSWGLTHCSFCSLGVLLPVSSRQEIGFLLVISVSTYRGSFHCVPYYILHSLLFFFFKFFVSLLLYGILFQLNCIY